MPSAPSTHGPRPISITRPSELVNRPKPRSPWSSSRAVSCASEADAIAMGTSARRSASTTSLTSRCNSRTSTRWPGSGLGPGLTTCDTGAPGGLPTGGLPGLKLPTAQSAQAPIHRVSSRSSTATIRGIRGSGPSGASLNACLTRWARRSTRCSWVAAASFLSKKSCHCRTGSDGASSAQPWRKLASDDCSAAAPLSYSSRAVKVPLVWFHSNSCRGAPSEGCSGSAAAPACTISVEPTNHCATSPSSSGVSSSREAGPRQHRCRGEPTAPTAKEATASGHPLGRSSARPVDSPSRLRGWAQTSLASSCWTIAGCSSAGSRRATGSLTCSARLLERVVPSASRLPHAVARSSASASARPATYLPA